MGTVGVTRTGGRLGRDAGDVLPIPSSVSVQSPAVVGPNAPRASPNRYSAQRQSPTDSVTARVNSDPSQIAARA